MKLILLKIHRNVLRCLYFFLKLFPTERKAVFISRQSDEISLDFKMLEERIKESDSTIKTVMLCRRLRNSTRERMHYIPHMFYQMYHIATARLVILDSYCIAVSVLKHKDDLKVIQMWHALGLFKKFGYASIGTDEGRDESIAEVMCMHRKYDYVICSSPFIKKEIAQAYDINIENVIALGLPRIDYLKKISDNQYIKNKIYELYPALYNGRKNVLYVPTFRTNGNVRYNELLESFDKEKFNIIIKLHNGSEKIYCGKKAYSGNSELKGMDFFAVADFVVSDYSAIIFEAILAHKPLYLFCYDIDSYLDRRGLFIDYDSIPAFKSKSAKIIAKTIENNSFDFSDYDEFLNRYITYRNINITDALAKMCIKCIDNKNYDKQKIIDNCPTDFNNKEKRRTK